MALYRKKPVVIEAITFEEFIEYGKAHTDHLVDGMPWHFEYKGYPVTHANDECYIIPTLEGEYSFTPKDMLITGIKGEINPCKKDIFYATYEKVEDISQKPKYAEVCTDNRFELIKKYKDKLIKGTNIEDSKDEMAVIDNILFRFWQMGWLDKLEADVVPRSEVEKAKQEVASEALSEVNVQIYPYSTDIYIKGEELIIIPKPDYNQILANLRKKYIGE